MKTLDIAQYLIPFYPLSHWPHSRFSGDTGCTPKWQVSAQGGKIKKYSFCDSCRHLTQGYDAEDFEIIGLRIQKS